MFLITTIHIMHGDGPMEEVTHPAAEHIVVLPWIVNHVHTQAEDGKREISDINRQGPCHALNYPTPVESQPPNPCHKLGNHQIISDMHLHFHVQTPVTEELIGPGGPGGL